MFKRGRGRPPGRGRGRSMMKGTSSEETSFNESTDIVVADTESGDEKPSVETSNETSIEASIETPIEMQIETPIETPIKRGRGRPKKTPTTDTSKVIQKNDSEDAQHENEENEDVNESTGPTPKKRGRKPKSEILQKETDKLNDIEDEPDLNQRKSQRSREKRTDRYSPEPPIISRKKNLNDVNASPRKKTDKEDEAFVENLKELPSDNPNEMKFITENGEEVTVPVPDKIRAEREDEDVLKEEEKSSKKDPDFDPLEMEVDSNENDDDKEDNENDIVEQSDLQTLPPAIKFQGPKMISTPIDSPKRGRGRPRKNPLPIEKDVVNTSSIISPPKKQPILTTVKSGKPLTTRAPVLNDANKLPTSLKKPVSTIRLTTTADPIPPRSSFSSLPQIQQHIRGYPNSNQSRFNFKRTMTTLNKYMETLPEISSCVLPNDYDVKENLEKLPDKIVLISTELPFDLAQAVEFSDQVYLFRQAINPVTNDQSKHICLLCKGDDIEYSTKEQKDLERHYSTMHELEVAFGTAKYSDDMVYICLPNAMMSQVSVDNPELKLNCQYCHPTLYPLSTIKEHYMSEHGKGVEFIVQEELNDQYHKFSCSICCHTSLDFENHHSHMKLTHQYKTYKCKSCSFITADETRMRTHFKAKHMLHNSGQNFQCNYCRGLLIGKERLNKHIQQTHMVQTGKDFSCIACRQVVGKGSPVYLHAEICEPANKGLMLEKCTRRYIPKTLSSEPLEENQYDCYFCNVRVNGKDNYDRHLLHAHMIWVPDPMYVVDGEAGNKLLTISEVITDQELADAEVETFVGHWCRHCDILIRCYQLYYLHMANHHRMIKVFQCIISECRATFGSFESFKEHIDRLEHSQKTILTHPDQVFACVYCDLYFANKDKYIQHLISNDHINKYTNSGHFQRTEPRNYKCKACFTMFGMKESYIHHLETESHQYVCPACMIVTAQSAARRAHIQNSHHDLINNCDECGEIHSSDSELTTHFVSHGFTFACPECPKKFYQREKLNTHMEVHHGEIVCQWEGCEKKIATMSMLVTHYRNHKSNHKCRFCNQAFWNENMLQSHMRSHRPALKQTRGGTMFRRDVTAYSRNKECEYCDAILKSPREINSHRCPKMPVNKRMLDLVTRAAAEISPSTVSTNSVSGKYAQLETEETNEMNENDTQVIMILNQNTGELMEITAPINMAVQDVIDAMQRNDGEFSASIEGTDVESLEVGPLKAVSENEPSFVQMVESKIEEATEVVVERTEETSEVVVENSEETQEYHERAVVEETQKYEGAIVGEAIVEETQTATHTESNVEYQNVDVEIVGENDDAQMIIVPSSMINQDGTIMLDPDTIERYNVKFAPDGSIISNHTFVLQSEGEGDVEEECIS